MFGLHGSAPHSLLEKGHVDANHPDLQVDPLNILRPASKLLHSLPLVSIFVAIYLHSCVVLVSGEVTSCLGAFTM